MPMTSSPVPENRNTPSVALSELPRLFDHTLLKPDATPAQIQKLCEEALQYEFATVCVNPVNVPQAAGILLRSSVKVCTVVGFPLGATLTDAKVYETQKSIDAGAREIDMVINIGALIAGLDDLVETDIRKVVEASHAQNAICKVILETVLLDREQKIRACNLVKSAGADFVKTSTGFASGGATVEDVSLMRAVAGPKMGVKAAGGIRTYEDVKKMVAAGATRLGSSSSVKILEEARLASR